MAIGVTAVSFSLVIDAIVYAQSERVGYQTGRFRVARMHARELHTDLRSKEAKTRRNSVYFSTKFPCLNPKFNVQGRNRRELPRFGNSRNVETLTESRDD